MNVLAPRLPSKGSASAARGALHPCKPRIEVMDSDASHANGLLSEIMPLAGLAVWDAWSDPLELISLDVGHAAVSAFSLEPAQMQAGALWEQSVYPPDRAKFHQFVEAPGSPR